ncbi:MAG: hypothetical protein QF362_02505 [Candidatus Woesearchaeota archaeon]|jgi:hypothetical protein|nr:hypothetical protein [Candidatus Woesearchaeota archaeon]MDP7506290.1 hypothetical protein [Candidatus Woesearchaeota archaeon]MDP7610507.1 hypothetical protein [Candidatus Woesearchaeota archaeon]|tara:strand:- start:14 stop:136 length:123 start_codon:yes stop_codon:yes gene_type:complete
MIKKEHIAKGEYLEKLDRIRKQKFIHIGSLENFKRRYKIK